MAPLTRFDRDTALEADGPGRFTGRIDRGRWIVAGPNGGYVAAILLRAAALTLDDPERAPVVMTTHYLRPPVEGEVTVEVTPERVGRTVASLTVRALQDGKTFALATTAFAGPRDPVLEFDDVPRPDVPPPAGCPPWPPEGEAMIPINDRYQTRWAAGVPPGPGPGSGGPSAPAECGGWLRTEDARETDHLLAAALTDGWVPPVFAKVGGPGMVAVPTVELTVYFRGGLPRPAGEYVLGLYRTRLSRGGFLEEEGELWSEDGQLLAQSRQLAALVGVPG